jgi:hypothetical protein
MPFVNRADELSALRAWWDRPNARPALVWGRRRVGKTALLQHFAASTQAPVVFHTGTGETAAAEIATLSRRWLPRCLRECGISRPRHTQPGVTFLTIWRELLATLGCC